MKDPADTHKYTFNNIIIAVRERLKKKNITIGYEKGFNSYVLNLFMNFYNIKTEQKYSYCHMIGKNEQYTYSQQLVEFLIEEICKDPKNFVDSLKTN